MFRLLDLARRVTGLFSLDILPDYVYSRCPFFGDSSLAKSSLVAADELKSYNSPSYDGHFSFREASRLKTHRPQSRLQDSFQPTCNKMPSTSKLYSPSSQNVMVQLDSLDVWHWSAFGEQASFHGLGLCIFRKKILGPE